MHKKSALFLDRDGVINVDYPYVHTREDFHFQGGIFDLCRAAQSNQYLLVVVTNQSRYCSRLLYGAGIPGIDRVDAGPVCGVASLHFARLLLPL